MATNRILRSINGAQEGQPAPEAPPEVQPTIGPNLSQQFGDVLNDPAFLEALNSRLTMPGQPTDLGQGPRPGQEADLRPTPLAGPSPLEVAAQSRAATRPSLEMPEFSARPPGNWMEDLYQSGNWLLHTPAPRAIQGFLEGARRDLRLGEAEADRRFNNTQMQKLFQLEDPVDGGWELSVFPDASGRLKYKYEQADLASRAQQTAEDRLTGAAAAFAKIPLTVFRLGLADAIGRDSTIVQPSEQGATDIRIGESAYGLAKIMGSMAISRLALGAIGVAGAAASRAEPILARSAPDMLGFTLATATTPGVTKEDIMDSYLLGGLWGQVSLAGARALPTATFLRRIVDTKALMPEMSIEQAGSLVAADHLTSNYARSILTMGAASAVLGGPTLSERQPGESFLAYRARQGMGGAIFAAIAGGHAYVAHRAALPSTLADLPNRPQATNVDEYFGHLVDDILREDATERGRRASRGGPGSPAQLSGGYRTPEEAAGAYERIRSSLKEMPLRLEFAGVSVDAVLDPQTRVVYTTTVEGKRAPRVYAEMADWGYRNGYKVLLPQAVPDTPGYHVRTDPETGFEMLTAGARAPQKAPMVGSISKPLPGKGGTITLETTKRMPAAEEERTRQMLRSRAAEGGWGLEKDIYYKGDQTITVPKGTPLGKGPGGWITPTERLEQYQLAIKEGRAVADATKFREMKASAAVYERSTGLQAPPLKGPPEIGDVVSWNPERDPEIGRGGASVPGLETLRGAGGTMRVVRIDNDAKTVDIQWDIPSSKFRTVLRDRPMSSIIRHVRGRLLEAAALNKLELPETWAAEIDRLSRSNDPADIPRLASIKDQLHGVMDTVPTASPDATRDFLYSVHAAQRDVTASKKDLGRVLAQPTAQAGEAAGVAKGVMSVARASKIVEDALARLSDFIPPTPDVTRAIRGEADFPAIGDYENHEITAELNKLHSYLQSIPGKGRIEKRGKFGQHVLGISEGPNHIYQRIADLKSEQRSRVQALALTDEQIIGGTVYSSRVGEAPIWRIVGRVPNEAPARPMDGFTVYKGEMGITPPLPGAALSGELYYTYGNVADLPGIAYEARRSLQEGMEEQRGLKLPKEGGEPGSSPRLFVTDTEEGMVALENVLTAKGFEMTNLNRMSPQRVMATFRLTELTVTRPPEEITGVLDALENPMKRGVETDPTDLEGAELLDWVEGLGGLAEVSPEQKRLFRSGEMKVKEAMAKELETVPGALNKALAGIFGNDPDTGGLRARGLLSANKAQEIADAAKGIAVRFKFKDRKDMSDYFDRIKGYEPHPADLLKARAERLGYTMFEKENGTWVLATDKSDEGPWDPIYIGRGKDSLGQMVGTLESGAPRTDTKLPEGVTTERPWVQEALENNFAMLLRRETKTGSVQWEVYDPANRFKKQTFETFDHAEEFLANQVSQFPPTAPGGAGAHYPARMPHGTPLKQATLIAEELRGREPGVARLLSDGIEYDLLLPRAKKAVDALIMKHGLQPSSTIMNDLATYLRWGSEIDPKLSSPIADVEPTRPTIFNRGQQVVITNVGIAAPRNEDVRSGVFRVSEVLPDGEVRLANDRFPDEGVGSNKRGITVRETDVALADGSEAALRLQAEYFKRQPGKILTPMTPETRLYLGDTVRLDSVSPDGEKGTVTSTLFPGRHLEVDMSDLETPTEENLNIAWERLDAVRNARRTAAAARSEDAAKALKAEDDARTVQASAMGGPLTQTEGIRYPVPGERKSGVQLNVALRGYTNVSDVDAASHNIREARSTVIGRGVTVHLDPTRTIGRGATMQIIADVRNPFDIRGNAPGNGPDRMAEFREMQRRLGDPDKVTDELISKGYDALITGDTQVVFDPRNVRVSYVPGIRPVELGQIQRQKREILGIRSPEEKVSLNGEEVQTQIEKHLLEKFSKQPGQLQLHYVTRMAKERGINVMVTGRRLHVIANGIDVAKDIKSPKDALDAYRSIIKEVARVDSDRRIQEQLNGLGGITGEGGPGLPQHDGPDNIGRLLGMIKRKAPGDRSSFFDYMTQAKNPALRLESRSGGRIKAYSGVVGPLTEGRTAMDNSFHDFLHVEKTTLGKYTDREAEKGFLYLMTPLNERPEVVKAYGITANELKFAREGLDMVQAYVDKEHIRDVNGDPVDVENFFSSTVPFVRKTGGKTFVGRSMMDRLAERQKILMEEIRTGEFNIQTDLPNGRDIFRQMTWLMARGKFLEPLRKQAEAVIYGRAPYEPIRSRSGKAVLENFVKGVFGVPDGVTEALGDSLRNGLEKSFGLVTDAAEVNQLLFSLMLMNYHANLGGLRPSSAMRQVLEGPLKLIPLAGTKVFGKAWAKVFGKDLKAALPGSEVSSLREEAVQMGLVADEVLPDIRRGGWNKFNDISFAGLRWGDAYSRLLAYATGKEMLLDGVKKATRADGSIDMPRAIRKSRLDGFLYDVQLGEIFDAVRRGDTESAARLAGKHIEEDAMGIYRQGHAPYFMHNAVGKVGGMYGQWPLNYAVYLKRLATMGPKRAIAAKAARWVGTNAAAFALANVAFGANDVGWLFFGPMYYTGGPAVSMGIQAATALRGRIDDPRTAQALKLLLTYGVSQAVPFSGFARDIGIWPGQSPRTGVLNQYTLSGKIGAIAGFRRPYGPVLSGENLWAGPPAKGEKMTMEEYMAELEGSGQTQSPAPQGKSNLKR